MTTSPAATSGTPVQAEASSSWREPQVVVQTVQQFGCQPEIGAKLTPSQRRAVTECFQGDSAATEPVRCQDELAIGQAIGGDVAPAQAVLALGRGAAAGGDELAQRAPAVEVVRQRDQAKAPVTAVEHELAAGQQLEAELLRLRMRAHQPGHRAFIGDGQRAVAQRVGARHQFLGMRRADLEAEVAAAVQLGVGGERRKGGGCRWGGLHDWFSSETGHAETTPAGPRPAPAARGRSTAGRPARCGRRSSHAARPGRRRCRWRRAPTRRPRCAAARPAG